MNCLLCYKPLDKGETDYHAKCVKKVFGLKQMPVIDIDEEKLVSYAKEIVQAKTAIAGVQPKLSVWIDQNSNKTRFTLVDNNSNYIIKPQSEIYIALPENEDLCMHMAGTFGIKTATHGLVRVSGGKIAYITKRFDRIHNAKLACEDLCQLTETLTEHKYRGSYEHTGQTIKKFSSQKGLDALAFFQLVVFAFISGNGDMHLKNFSMLESEEGYFSLSPAYDLFSSVLVIKDEEEQMALNVNGRKKNLFKKGFDRLAESLDLPEKAVGKCYHEFFKLKAEAMWWIDNSFLPAPQKVKLKNILVKRISLLNA